MGAEYDDLPGPLKKEVQTFADVNVVILRAVLRQVSPRVIRLVSVSDHMPLPEFHDVFRIILGWNGDLGYIIRVHGHIPSGVANKARPPRPCSITASSTN